MVKVNAPAMSLDASGSLAGTLVFSKWKGRNYVRQLVRPANPRDPKQVGIRSMFKYLAQSWKGMAALIEATYEELAEQNVYSPFNAYMSVNMNRWRLNKAPTKLHPATEDDDVGVGNHLAPVGGKGHVTVTYKTDTLNDTAGWMIFRSPTAAYSTSYANCVAVLWLQDVDEHTWIDSPLVAGSYYYDARVFTNAGVLGAEMGEQVAVVT